MSQALKRIIPILLKRYEDQYGEKPDTVVSALEGGMFVAMAYKTGFS